MSATYFLTEFLKLVERFLEYRKWSKRPFKPDRDRYQIVMDNISVSDIYYFRDWEELYHNFSSDRYDGIWTSACALSTIHAPSFIDKELRAKELKLLDALKGVWDLMRRRLYFNRERTTCTIYWDDYDATNSEHRQGIITIRAELNEALDQLIEAFEDFQDCGNEKFAIRLSEGANLVGRE